MAGLKLLPLKPFLTISTMNNETDSRNDTIASIINTLSMLFPP